MTTPFDPFLHFSKPPLGFLLLHLADFPYLLIHTDTMLFHGEQPYRFHFILLGPAPTAVPLAHGH